MNNKVVIVLPKQILANSKSFTKDIQTSINQFYENQGTTKDISMFCPDWILDDLENHFISSTYKFLVHLVTSRNNFASASLLQSTFRFRKTINAANKQFKFDFEYTHFVKVLECNSFILKIYEGTRGRATEYTLGHGCGTEIAKCEIKSDSFYKDSVSYKHLLENFKGNCKTPLRESQHGFDLVYKQIRNFSKVTVDDIDFIITDVQKNNKLTIDRLLKGVYTIMKIKYGYFNATYSYQKRLYTNITNLKKEFRKYIFLEKKELHEIDIPASQPLLLFSLWKKETNLTNEDIIEQKRLGTIFEEGLFYETLILGHRKIADYNFKIDVQNVCIKDIKKHSERSKEWFGLLDVRNYVKNNFLKLLFDASFHSKQFSIEKVKQNIILASYNIHDKDTKEFSDLQYQKVRGILSLDKTFPRFRLFLQKMQSSGVLPTVTKYKNELIRNEWEFNYKKFNNCSLLWHKTQLMESEIIQTVLRNTQIDTFLTIHDSILVNTKLNSNLVKDELQTVLHSYTGLQINL